MSQPAARAELLQERLTTNSSERDSPASKLEWFVRALMWMLSLMVFTMPTAQHTDQWQLLDVIKIGVLAFACFGGAIALMSRWSDPIFRAVLDPLTPFYLFLGWALISTSWSPLPGVTIAQSGSLVAMLFFATAVAIVATNSICAKRILLQLNWVLLVSSTIVLFAYVIDPEMSGLDRDRIHAGGDGLIHPTASGATASLGLMLPVLCHQVGRFSWAWRLILPSVMVHGLVLVLSNSRTALVMAAVTIGLVLFRYCTNRQRALALIASAALALGVLVIDPGFELTASTADVGAQFVTRGQSSEQLMGVSGRGELWSAVWNEFEKSMLVGHGYFVSSEAGTLHVWDQTHNYTAHNLALQILVSTGAIGFMIFSFALVQLFGLSMTLRHGSEFQQRIFVMVVVTAIWFAGWSQLGDSFLGPIRPESILFFCFVGIAVGQSTILTKQ